MRRGSRYDNVGKRGNYHLPRAGLARAIKAYAAQEGQLPVEFIVSAYLGNVDSPFITRCYALQFSLIS